MNNQMFIDIRHYLNMTQGAFSDHTGISRSVIALIETDRMRVTENVQAKLARVFEVTDDFLVYQQSKRDIEQLLKNDNK